MHWSHRSQTASAAAGHNLELTALRHQARWCGIRHHHSRQSVASHLRKRQFFSVHCNWGILPPSYPRDVLDSHERKASVYGAGERQTAAERQIFSAEVSLWRILFDPERRSLV